MRLPCSGNKARLRSQFKYYFDRVRDELLTIVLVLVVVLVLDRAAGYHPERPSVYR